MKLLIVDDSKAMQMLVRRTLRQAGYGDHAISEADDAEKALVAVRQDTPDLVLSDWNMPGASGLDLLKSITSEGIKTRFGFVTSEGSDEMRQAAEAAGAEFLISKPFTVQAFQAALEPILGTAATSGASSVSTPTKPVAQMDAIPLRPGRLPQEGDLRRFLGELFGHSVDVNSGAKLALVPGPIVVASYEDSGGEVRALFAADIPGAVYLAAALSLIPGGPVKDAIKSKVLDPAIMASFREVANVLAAAIQGASGQHVKLVDVCAPPAKPSALTLALAKKPSARQDFRVEMSKYGAGIVSFILR
ncbi:MAG: response regulator [Deltaproteobacteria bacterium]|nr:response regulator [Deltaproteobacteria bacterium]